MTSQRDFLIRLCPVETADPICSLRLFLKSMGRIGLECVSAEYANNQPAQQRQGTKMSATPQTAIAIRPADQFMPVMSPSQALERRTQMIDMTRKIMKPGIDFGAIPGTGTKPALLKAGAEKLVSFFGLTPKMDLVESVCDWTGEKHGGRPLIAYRYKVGLYRGDLLIAEAEGSANLWESKWFWRKADRMCPECSASAIIQGKADYGGGWVCFKKKGGCGAKFPAGDARIESQKSGRVQNPDLYDQVNTVGKLAHKRALVAAVLLATNASEFFAGNLDEDQPESAIDDDAIRVDGNGEPDVRHTPTFQATWLAEMQLRGFTTEHAGQILDEALSKSKLSLDRTGATWRNGALNAVRGGRFDRLLPQTVDATVVGAAQDDPTFPDAEPAPSGTTKPAAPPVAPAAPDLVTWDGFLNSAFAAAEGQADAETVTKGINLALVACGLRGKGPKTQVSWRQEMIEAIERKAFDFKTGVIDQVAFTLTDAEDK